MEPKSTTSDYLPLLVKGIAKWKFLIALHNLARPKAPNFEFAGVKLR